eukprot:CAMPEP_0172688708 /NCGR_PEP_ID=MMETSP1074-20121228/22605_1 /TAXON_ID=2916 /ORGANISM="Ceratium fusus, Strain PA161109" /LENGTH=84 /DNA_ID=CAMNT_0013508409 /DNA_START=57 /DNA_END=311 /DNA_ORIENTATION=-
MGTRQRLHSAQLAPLPKTWAMVFPSSGAVCVEAISDATDCRIAAALAVVVIVVIVDVDTVLDVSEVVVVVTVVGITIFWALQIG